MCQTRCEVGSCMLFKYLSSHVITDQQLAVVLGMHVYRFTLVNSWLMPNYLA